MGDGIVDLLEGFVSASRGAGAEEGVAKRAGSAPGRWVILGLANEGGSGGEGRREAAAAERLEYNGTRANGVNFFHHA